MFILPHILTFFSQHTDPPLKWSNVLRIQFNRNTNHLMIRDTKKMFCFLILKNTKDIHKKKIITIIKKKIKQNFTNKRNDSESVVCQAKNTARKIQ